MCMILSVEYYGSFIEDYKSQQQNEYNGPSQKQPARSIIPYMSLISP